MVKLRTKIFNFLFCDIAKVLSILKLTKSLCHTAKRNFNKMDFFLV